MNYLIYLLALLPIFLIDNVWLLRSFAVIFLVCCCIYDMLATDVIKQSEELLSDLKESHEINKELINKL